MKNFAILIFTLISGGLIAQEEINQTDSQGRKHGVWKKYYPNEQLRYEGRFEHGVEVDTFKFYFKGGDLKAVNYFRGNGEAYSWQYGGEDQLAAEGKYIDAKRDSTWTFYDIDGNLISRENYKDDKKHGKVITYFDNGKKAEVTHYEKGVKQGPWLQFYDTGKPKAKGEYVNGKLHGEVTYFEPNGKPGIKGNYRKGLMHGNWYFFDEGMEIEKKQVWDYGKNITEQDSTEEQASEEEETIEK